MIRVRRRKWVGGRLIHGDTSQEKMTYYTCPGCGNEDWYILHPDHKCKKCGCLIPDINRMLSMSIERVLWHFGHVSDQRGVILLGPSKGIL